MTLVVLHLAPHPDDELLGAPATLMALRDAGHRVVNLACSVGRARDERRRRVELEDACALAGFELLVPERPAAISRDDDPMVAFEALVKLIREAIAGIEPQLVCSPTPHDRHPGHELVGRAARTAIGDCRQPPRWWMWGLWGPLPLPTLGTAFDKARLEEIYAALAAHRGELLRNDYRRLLEGRGKAYACLAPELLFGFGAAAARDVSYAELLTEAVRAEGRWLLGRPHWLDQRSPLAEPSEKDVGEWLEAPSLSQRFDLWR